MQYTQMNAIQRMGKYRLIEIAANVQLKWNRMRIRKCIEHGVVVCVLFYRSVFDNISSHLYFVNIASLLAFTFIHFLFSFANQLQHAGIKNTNANMHTRPR